MLIICHYAEIGLKGGNRRKFEQILVSNIKKALDKGFLKQIKRISGRIIVNLEDSADKKQVKNILQNIFGLSHFSFAVEAEQDLKQIKKTAIDFLKDKKFETFRISAKRSNKEFILDSQQINEQVGEYVVKKMDKKVKLKNPDLELFIEIVENRAFLFSEKNKGLGGLPVGSSEKAICLLSSGIDSPVAAFFAMKRGIIISFVHFITNNEKEPLAKVKKLIKILKKYHQPNINVYFIEFREIQKQIFEKGVAKYGCVICKRSMLKIAENVARKEQAQAVITGDNLGQVASQTLPNMAVIEKAIQIPVLRPLLCFDKQETIEKSKKLGLYDVSILPESHFCANLVAKHPCVKSDLEIIEKIENKIKLKLDLSDLEIKQEQI